MDEKEWKERGTGTIKLLERKDTPGKSRLLMRRDHVHKICLNHAIYAELKMVAMGPQGNGMHYTLVTAMIDTREFLCFCNADITFTN